SNAAFISCRLPSTQVSCQFRAAATELRLPVDATPIATDEPAKRCGAATHPARNTWAEKLAVASPRSSHTTRQPVLLLPSGQRHAAFDSSSLAELVHRSGVHGQGEPNPQLITWTRVRMCPRS